MNSKSTATLAILAILFPAMTFAGDSSSPTPAPSAAATTGISDKAAIEKLSLIPLPKKPMSGIAGARWHNPVVNLTNGQISADGSKVLSPENLLGNLARIPRSGWPQGRVVEIVTVAGLAGPADPAIQAKVESLLKSAGIEIVYNGSSA